MPLYMDRHDVPGATGEDIARAQDAGGFIKSVARVVQQPEVPSAVSYQRFGPRSSSNACRVTW